MKYGLITVRELPQQLESIVLFHDHSVYTLLTSSTSGMVYLYSMLKYLARLEEETGETVPKDLWDRARALVTRALVEVPTPSAPHVMPHADGVILFVWANSKTSVHVELNAEGCAWNTCRAAFPTGSSTEDSDVLAVLKSVFGEKR